MVINSLVTLFQEIWPVKFLAAAELVFIAGAEILLSSGIRYGVSHFFIFLKIYPTLDSSDEKIPGIFYFKI